MSDTRASYTVLPWYISGTVDGQSYVQSVPLESDGFVAQIEGEENAEYIVRACNAYPAMLEALKQIKYMAAHFTPYATRKTFGTIEDFASEALRIAQGATP